MAPTFHWVIMHPWLFALAPSARFRESIPPGTPRDRARLPIDRGLRFTVTFVFAFRVRAGSFTDPEQ